VVWPKPGSALAASGKPAQHFGSTSTQVHRHDFSGVEIISA